MMTAIRAMLASEIHCGWGASMLEPNSASNHSATLRMEKFKYPMVELKSCFQISVTPTTPAIDGRKYTARKTFIPGSFEFSSAASSSAGTTASGMATRPNTTMLRSDRRNRSSDSRSTKFRMPTNSASVSPSHSVNANSSDSTSGPAKNARKPNTLGATNSSPSMVST